MTRYELKDGIVLSLESDVGDFDRADVLVEDRINGAAAVGALPPGVNRESNPSRPRRSSDARRVSEHYLKGPT